MSNSKVVQINSKDLDIVDINARLQAICLKLQKDDDLQLGVYKVCHKRFGLRAPELNQTTLTLMLPHIKDLEHYDWYSASGKLFLGIIQVCNRDQLLQLFKQSPELTSKTYNSGQIACKPLSPTKLTQAKATDPEWNTIYAKAITIDRYTRQHMLAALDPANGFRHLQRYPADIDLAPLDVAGVTKLLPTIEASKHDEQVIDSLCNNESAALFPVYAKLINENCMKFTYKQREFLERMLDSGYTLTCASPRTATAIPGRTEKPTAKPKLIEYSI